MTTEDDDEGSNALENRGTYILNGVDWRVIGFIIKKAVIYTELQST